jgi:hypothetical protein
MGCEEDTEMGTLLRRHPLASYFTLAHGFTWAIALPLGAGAHG